MHVDEIKYLDLLERRPDICVEVKLNEFQFSLNHLSVDPARLTKKKKRTKKSSPELIMGVPCIELRPTKEHPIT